jgi:competence protein ComFC
MTLFIKELYKIFFPKNCLACQEPDFWICPACLTSLEKSYENKDSFITSLFNYKDSRVRKIVWFIKFNKKHSVLDDIEERIRDHVLKFIEKNNLSKKELVVIPIPLTKRSLHKRGYNQADLISLTLRQIPNIKIERNILFKTKNHLPQNKIKNRQERMSNVVNSFGVKNENKIEGEIILLIDDVTTTGATLKEAKHILKEHGAKKVYAFTLAH